MTTIKMAPAVFAVPGEDPLERIVREIEKRVDEGGWDQPTHLHWLTVVPTVGIGVKRPSLPEPLGLMHPAALLSSLASTINGSGEPALRQMKWCGFVLVYELWGAFVDPNDFAALATLRADADAKRIDQRADRVEQRLAHGIFYDGREFLIGRIRGAEPEPLPRVVGTVPEALRMLTTSCAEAVRR